MCVTEINSYLSQFRRQREELYQKMLRTLSRWKRISNSSVGGHGLTKRGKRKRKFDLICLDLICESLINNSINRKLSNQNTLKIEILDSTRSITLRNFLNFFLIETPLCLERLLHSLWLSELEGAGLLGHGGALLLGS